MTKKVTKADPKPKAKPKTTIKPKKVKLVESIIEGVVEKKGKDIVWIDLSSKPNLLYDNFIICHADSSVHIQAIADSIEDVVWETLQIKPHATQGQRNAVWIVIDYFDTVVHIFQREYRDFYRLEDLWADAKIKRIE